MVQLQLHLQSVPDSFSSVPSFARSLSPLLRHSPSRESAGGDALCDSRRPRPAVCAAATVVTCAAVVLSPTAVVCFGPLGPLLVAPSSSTTARVAYGVFAPVGDCRADWAPFVSPNFDWLRLRHAHRLRRRGHCRSRRRGRCRRRCRCCSSLHRLTRQFIIWRSPSRRSRSAYACRVAPRLPPRLSVYRRPAAPPSPPLRVLTCRRYAAPPSSPPRAWVAPRSARASRAHTRRLRRRRRRRRLAGRLWRRRPLLGSAVLFGSVIFGGCAPGGSVGPAAPPTTLAVLLAAPAPRRFICGREGARLVSRPRLARRRHILVRRLHRCRWRHSLARPLSDVLHPAALDACWVASPSPPPHVSNRRRSVSSAPPLRPSARW